jgi:hypothetical protein
MRTQAPNYQIPSRPVSPKSRLRGAVLLPTRSLGRDQRLDQHRFRPLGKLVVGNLDRIADIDNVGN